MNGYLNTMLCTTSYGELTQYLGVLVGNTLDILSDITDQLSPYSDGGLVVHFLSISLSNFIVNYPDFLSEAPRRIISMFSRWYTWVLSIFCGFSTSIVLIFCRDCSKRIYSVFFSGLSLWIISMLHRPSHVKFSRNIFSASRWATVLDGHSGYFFGCHALNYLVNLSGISQWLSWCYTTHFN
jgi:hypothetical protein